MRRAGARWWSRGLSGDRPPSGRCGRLVAAGAWSLRGLSSRLARPVSLVLAHGRRVVALLAVVALALVATLVFKVLSSAAFTRGPVARRNVTNAPSDTSSDATSQP